MQSKQNKMSWFSLEAISNWGAPIEVDGTKLMFHQAKVLMGIVEDLMDNAKFDKPAAIEHALGAFRLMYEKRGKEWRAKKTIELKDRHGVSVKSKFHRKDQRERMMVRVRAEIAEKHRRQEIIQDIKEAGRRNSGKDKGAIDSAMAGLFDLLNKTDQEAVVKSLGKKLGRNLRFKKEAS